MYSFTELPKPVKNEVYILLLTISATKTIQKLFNTGMEVKEIKDQTHGERWKIFIHPNK